MQLFPYAHATHPQWPMAAALVLAQLRGHMALPQYASNPTLALLYITDHYAAHADAILEHLSGELPLVTDWSGTVGVGIASNNVEYFDEPAMAVMLLDIPSDQYRVFSGVAPLGLGFEAHTALVHADGRTFDLGDLVHEMAGRTSAGYLFGGVSSSRARSVQFAVAADGNLSGHGGASGVFSGGLSGVAFSEEVAVLSRVTQGCSPVSKARVITEADRNLVVSLDGEPALDVLLADLHISLDQPEQALDAVRATLVALAPPPLPVGGSADAGMVRRTGNLGSEVTVRHIIGLDPGRRGIAVTEQVQAGTQFALCRRDREAARVDLTRIGAEIREELEPLEMSLELATALQGDEAQAAPHPARQIAGAVYVSCSGRGGPHFGAPSAELQIVRRALGDVPLVGFFADGEIAGERLYGYTGVLTVFVK